ncbi:MAG: HPF/RaiA family ribosome-associated protein [Beijerinckiaceae bacterium]|nr:HPF/RaiA family ribosome-associated protein [Beijerinckiaceae bacterium]
MQIQFNSDNNVDGDSGMADRVQELVRTRLSRVEERLTRVEVHVGDIDGPRSGANDKRALVELRPAGLQPVSGSAQAASIEAAVSSAIDKALAAFDRQIGKMTTRKGH